MTKLTIEDLTGDMPEGMIIAALDDDRDGIPDEGPFQSALASANARADAIFGGSVPARYARRADEEAARLRALASGTEAIDASEDGVVISKPARIYNTQGVMS